MTFTTEPDPAMKPEVSVTIEWTDDAAVLTVVGAVDYVTTPQVRAAVLATLVEGPTLLVLDLLAVDFLGSPGLSLLVETASAVEPKTRLRVAAGRIAARPIQVTGLAGHFELYPTVADALAPTA